MLIVVGGHSRKVGKTSVIAALIRALADAEWTAVKITPHAHSIEELATADSARYLAAGARRSFVLRSPALPEIREALAGAHDAIIESNSVLDLIDPDLYLMVLDFSVSDFKDSARRHIGRADAFVIIESAVAQPAWDSACIESKPAFVVKPPEYASPALIEFIRRNRGGRAFSPRGLKPAPHAQ